MSQLCHNLARGFGESWLRHCGVAHADNGGSSRTRTAAARRGTRRQQRCGAPAADDGGHGTSMVWAAAVRANWWRSALRREGRRRLVLAAGDRDTAAEGSSQSAMACSSVSARRGSGAMRTRSALTLMSLRAPSSPCPVAASLSCGCARSTHEMVDSTQATGAGHKRLRPGAQAATARSGGGRSACR